MQNTDSSRDQHSMALKSLARNTLFSYSTEPLFIEHCGLSTTNVQTQTLISHKDNTILKILQELHFPFCAVKVNPLSPLRSLGVCWVIHGVQMFTYWVLHKCQTSIKQSLHLTNRL